MVLTMAHQCNESVADLEASVVARGQLSSHPEHQPVGLVSRGFPVGFWLVMNIVRCVDSVDMS